MTRYKAVAVEPESAFIQGLRNFTLHHALPFVGHTVHISDPGTTPSATVDIQLSSEDLLSGDRWNATARTFIMRGNAVSLTPVIEVHGLLIVELHHWLLRALADANEPALGEVNELIVERTAALLDADTERARMITARWTAARQSPEPPADFEALLGNPRKQDEAA